MMSFRTVPEREARAVLRQQLIGSKECDQVASDCALLRSCVWALTGGQTPVHVLRLLNFATSLDPSDEEIRPRLKESLEELSDAGDLVELANGRWLPAPTREVRLGTTNDTRLIVGGLPTSVLPAELKSKLEHSGPFRRTKGEHLSKALDLPAEDQASWMGESHTDLRSWAQKVLDGKYEMYRDEHLHLYAPELFAASRPQAIRWVERPDKLSGRYLGQQNLPFGLKRHLGVEIVSGKVTRIKTLHCGDFRRLLYGLDLLAGKPVVVEESDQHGDFVIVLKSELPKSERRLFAALGTLTVAEGNYYPRTWRFPNEYTPEVRSRLEALGIQISRRTSR
jgi:hypothetical protein